MVLHLVKSGQLRSNGDTNKDFKSKNLTVRERIECENLKVNNSVDIHHSMYMINSGEIEGVGTLRVKKLYYERMFQESSRGLKSDTSKISSNSANDILMKLNPVKYKLKNEEEQEENLGFIAEEVPDIFSDKDHKTVKIMDIVAALVKVVQEQQKKIEILENK